MSKKKFIKKIGIISEDVIKKYKLEDYRGVSIIQSLDLYAHVYKHINEFQSIDNFNYAISNISDVINDPLFVYYDKNKNSLMYFKKMKENVCSVVKLNLVKNKDVYVSTIYPVSDNKIQKYKELSYIIGEM